MPIVQRPLAAVIARADGPVGRPRQMEGHRVGVTGLALRRSGGRLRGRSRRRRPGQGRRGDDRLQRRRLAGRRQGRRRDRLLERRGGGAARTGRPHPHLQGRPNSALRPTPSWFSPPRGRRSRTTRSWSKRLSQRPARATTSPRNTPDRARRPRSPPTPSSNGPNRRRSCRCCCPVLRPQPFDDGCSQEWAAWDLGTACWKSRSDVEQAFPTRAGSSRDIRERGTDQVDSRRPRPPPSSRRRRGSSSRAPASPARPAPRRSRRRGRRRSGRGPPRCSPRARARRRPRGRRRSASRRPCCRASGRWRC